jgi:Protein of unknown function (DUF2934)
VTEQRESQRRETGTPASEDVARRAYELFQARGCEPGHDLEHWLEAERELSRTSSSEAHEQPDLVAIASANRPVGANNSSDFEYKARGSRE